VPRRALLAGCLALLASFGPAAAQDAPLYRHETVQDHADCYCRGPTGERSPVGESACLVTAEGPRIAECRMVLNNPSWRVTTRPCPES
jgi:hypothetical protein